MPHKARNTESFQFSFGWYLTKIPSGLFCITRFLAWFPLEMRRMWSCCLPICHVLLRNFIINGCTSVRSNRRDPNVISSWEVWHWLVWQKSPKLVYSLGENQQWEFGGYRFDLVVGWWQPTYWQVNKHAWSCEPFAASAAFSYCQQLGGKEIFLCLENLKRRSKKLGDTEVLHLRAGDTGHKARKRLPSSAAQRKKFLACIFNVTRLNTNQHFHFTALTLVLTHKIMMNLHGCL